MIQSLAILMATYNGEKYIAEQLDSIIQQDYSNWILYINDDNSTDQTKSILERYCLSNPDKIVLSSNTSSHHGATANFADLFQKVNGHDAYLFCDQDDIWEVDKLSTMVEQMNQQTGSQTVPMLGYCSMKITDQTMHELSPSLEDYTHTSLDLNQTYTQLLLANYVPGCAMIFNQALKDLIGIFPDTIDLHDWWILFVCSAFGRIFHVEGKALSSYRQHSSNVLGVANTKSTILRILDNLKPSVFKKHMQSLINCREQAIRQNETFLKLYSDRLSTEKCMQTQEVLSLLQNRNRLYCVMHGMKYPYLGNTFYERFIFWWFVTPKA